MRSSSASTPPPFRSSAGCVVASDTSASPRGLDAAADYLGLTETQLRSELQGGKTLAQVAQAHGKTANGLIDALVANAKTRLDQAVAAGRLTQSQANEILSGLRDRIDNLVNSKGPVGDHLGRPQSGFRHFGGPPA